MGYRSSTQVPPNSALQRSGTHKVLGLWRPSAERTRALRARVLIRWRAAAELGSWAAFPKMKAIFAGLILASSATAATLEDVSRVTGTFSSLAFNEESGDLGGKEISIVYGGGGHHAIAQCSEGEPGVPVVARVQVQGQRVTFTIPKESGSGCPEATFVGTVSTAGLTGQFVGFGDPELLQRKPSYWK